MAQNIQRHSPLTEMRETQTMKTSILSLAALVLASSSAHAQLHWYVDASVPGPGTGSAQDPFPAIQTAIDASSADDTVHLAAGGYQGNLVIDHDLSIIGSGSGFESGVGFG